MTIIPKIQRNSVLNFSFFLQPKQKRLFNASHFGKICKPIFVVIEKIATNQKFSKIVTLIGIFSILSSEFLKLENGNKLNDRDFAK